MLFLLVAPIFFILGFKGSMKGPFGTMTVSNREQIKSSAYGLFKTVFSYLPELREVSQSVSSLSQVVDVGANLGDFTLALASQSTAVLAIEPDRENFSILCQNIYANRFRNVTPKNIAAHDREEEVTLQGVGSTTRITTAGLGEHAEGAPLDAVLEQVGITSADLMKLDVQGHEMKVLLGLRRSLKNKLVKLLVVEVHPYRTFSAKDIVSLMQGFGYHLIAQRDYLFDQLHLYFRPNHLLGSDGDSWDGTDV